MAETEQVSLVRMNRDVLHLLDVPSGRTLCGIRPRGSRIPWEVSLREAQTAFDQSQTPCPHCADLVDRVLHPVADHFAHLRQSSRRYSLSL